MQTDPKDLTPKARRTRTSLLDAGRKLTGLYGSAGVNVMAVCAEAGVGRTSFYNYFEDVEALVAAVAIEAAKEIKARFDNLHSCQPRGRERLRACLKMILLLAVENPDTTLLLTSLVRSSPEVRNLLWSEIHTELSAVDELQKEDVTKLSDFLAITTLALARQFAEGDLAPSSIDRHLEFLWRSVG